LSKPEKNIFPTHTSRDLVRNYTKGTMKIFLIVIHILLVSFSTFGEVPKTASKNHRIKKIAFGDKDTCLLYESGIVKCWGANQNGISGMAPTNEVLKPTQIKGIVDAEDLQVGDEFACVKTKSGTLKCWGNFANMNIGPTNSFSDLLNVSVAAPVKQMAVGGKHICVLLENKKLQCLGKNEFGQLGHGNKQEKASSTWVEIKQIRVSEKMGEVSKIEEIIPIREVKRITSGRFHTCALLVDDGLYCWGKDNVDYRFLTRDDNFVPRINTRGHNYTYSQSYKTKEFSLGMFHTCIVTPDDEAKCDGNWESRKFEKSWLIHENTSPLPDKFKSIFSGAHHACGILMNGRVKCWGPNNAGEIGKAPLEGDLPIKDTRQATEVKNITNAEKLFLGLDISCALLKDSSIKCWGSGFKLLGNSGETHIEPYPFTSAEF
jgi:alpha-tubulin suppressor-like RCC1 family protein